MRMMVAARSLLLAAVVLAAALPSVASSRELHELKSRLSRMTAAQIIEEVGEIKPLGPPPPHQSKIEHFVVLFMENRAFDHMLGCMDLPGLDGIPPEGRQIPVDPLNKSAGYVNVTCGSATYICNGTQSYSLWDGKFKNGSQAKAYPYGPQSDGWSVKNGGAKAGESVNMFSAEQLPIKKTLATEFGVFNKFFTSTPTASTPNHLFAQSCTSCGQIGNSLYNTVGGSTAMYPQLTIFDNMELNNVSFGLYMNNTNDPNWPKEYLTPVSVPDVVMSGVARYKDNFYNHSEFSAAAAAGTLPSFSWIMPPAPMMDHPCHDIALGERLHKDIYEALRAGKNWEKTLFLIMYDDGGDFYDHVVSPYEGVPADESPCNVPGHSTERFDFRRLGTRSTALAISPWIKKGSVIQEPAGPQNTSQWEHSSVSATIKNLFNLTSFLTKRDEWAGSLHELLTEDAPRTDSPMHLPTSPTPKIPFGPNWPPPPPSRRGLETAEGEEEDSPDPQHCGRVAPHNVCPGVTAVNTKQRNTIRLLSQLTATPEPNVDAMDYSAAEAWAGAQYHNWLAQGGPLR